MKKIRYEVDTKSKEMQQKETVKRMQAYVKGMHQAKEGR